MTPHPRLIMLSLLLLVVLPSVPGLAQPPPPPPGPAHARTLVSAAQPLIEKADWAQAQALLQQADAECRSASDPDTCRPLVDYSMGYFYQSQASETPASEKLLREARRRYRLVLKRSPNNGPALNNLALVEQALLAFPVHAAEQVALTRSIESGWQHAIQTNSAGSAQYALALGDFLVRQKRPDQALRYYQQAAASAPDSETPRERILANAAGLSPADFRANCQAWQESFPELAAQCYVHLMARPDGSAAEDALLRWVLLVARSDRLTPDRLAVLPTSVSDAAVSELRVYLQNPLADPRQTWHWWSSNLKRTAVTSQVAATGGRQLLRQPDGASKAAQCWENFLHAHRHLAEEVALSIEGKPPEALPIGLSDVLVLYQELASLYNRNPKLDPGKTKSRDMIRDLFQGKWTFIQKRDWQATQSFHTTLALIFIERGEWGTGGSPATAVFPAEGKNCHAGGDPATAIFQLQATLCDAQRRREDPQDLSFQPLPELKKLLAEAYVKTNHGTDAAQTYVEAAKAYLDTDALDASEAMLHESVKLVPQSDAAGALAQIVKARRNPQSLNPADFAAHRPAWLDSTAGALGKDFLARQQFKLLGDLASSPASETAQLQAALEAYQLVAEQKTALVGNADLLRWQRSEARLLASANAVAGTARVSYAADAASVPKDAVRLTLPGTTRSAYIAPDKQTSVAAQLVHTLGPAETLAVRPHLRLQNNRIVVPANSPATDPAVLDKVRKNSKLPVVVKPHAEWSRPN